MAMKDRRHTQDSHGLTVKDYREIIETIAAARMVAWRYQEVNRMAKMLHRRGVGPLAVAEEVNSIITEFWENVRFVDSAGGVVDEAPLGEHMETARYGWVDPDGNNLCTVRPASPENIAAFFAIGGEHA